MILVLILYGTFFVSLFLYILNIYKIFNVEKRTIMNIVILIIHFILLRPSKSLRAIECNDYIMLIKNMTNHYRYLIFII